MRRASAKARIVSFFETASAGMRYEAAPAIGPRTVFAGYVKDDIEGDTHIDTAYGVRAFDAINGRLLWDTGICRLPPGKFSAGVAVTQVGGQEAAPQPKVQERPKAEAQPEAEKAEPKAEAAPAAEAEAESAEAEKTEKPTE